MKITVLMTLLVCRGQQIVYHYGKQTEGVPL